MEGTLKNILFHPSFHLLLPPLDPLLFQAKSPHTPYFWQQMQVMLDFIELKQFEELQFITTIETDQTDDIRYILDSTNIDYRQDEIDYNYVTTIFILG